MLEGWRIVKARRAATAFDGEGARLNGGRWNSVGTPMVYLSQTISLAALEMLVHLQNTDLLLAYSVCPVSFDESLMNSVDEAALPPDWNAPSAPPVLQQMGDVWVRSSQSVVLRVPSAIVNTESNFLLNPRHPDWVRLAIGTARPFGFDTRLK